jgi:hypothetical protein
MVIALIVAAVGIARRVVVLHVSISSVGVLLGVLWDVEIFAALWGRVSDPWLCCCTGTCCVPGVRHWLCGRGLPRFRDSIESESWPVVAAVAETKLAASWAKVVLAGRVRVRRVVLSR